MTDTTTSPPTSREMTSEIEAAIARLEETATDAVPGPWQADIGGDEHCVRARSAIANPGAYHPVDMILERDVEDLWEDATTPGPDVAAAVATTAYIALMSPDVGLAVVPLLRVGLDYARLRDPLNYPAARAAYDLARLINREYVR